MSLTLSFHQQPNSARREHNIRNAHVVDKRTNIDSSLIHKNIIFKDMKLKEAYEEAYGESFRKFQAEQIKNKVRKDRIVGDYYKQVKNDSRRNLTYEAVLQIGNRDTVGIRTEFTKEELEYLRLRERCDIVLKRQDSNLDCVNQSFENTDSFSLNILKHMNLGLEIQDAQCKESASSSLSKETSHFESVEDVLQELTKHYSEEKLQALEASTTKVKNAILVGKCLTEFVETWEERNPKFFLYGAYLHADEHDGTLHLHLDYLPLATNYTRGQSVQNGLEKACQQNVELRLSKDQIKQRKAEHKMRTGKAKMSFENLWQDIQRIDLQDIATKHNLEIDWDRDTIKKQQHVNTPEFRARQEALKNINEQMEKQMEKVRKNELLIEDLNDELIELQTKLSNDNKEAKILQKRNTDLMEERDQLISATGRLKKSYVELTQEKSHIESEMDKMVADQQRLQEQLQQLIDELMQFEETQAKAKHYTEATTKTLFGNIKMSEDNYQDLIHTLQSALNYNRKMSEKAKLAEQEADQAKAEREKAVRTAKEAIESKQQYAKEQTEPLRDYIWELKRKLKEFAFLENMPKEEFEQLKQSITQRNEDRERLAQIENILEYRHSSVFSTKKFDFQFYDKEFLKMSEGALLQTAHEIVAKNHFETPNFLRDFLEEECEADLDEMELDID